MDMSKKRKTDENGDVSTVPEFTTLTGDDFRKLLQPMSHDHLVEILENAVVRHPDVLESLRHVTNRDLTLRKLFVRGLGADTTTDSLRSVFSAFGDLDEAIVIFDKATGKSKGYGFVTFKHADEALIALKEPSKKIDGRVTVTQYAAAGHSAPFSNSNGGASDVSARKIYVGTVPFDIPSERLLSAFAAFGEIEEGPLGFDKATGKSKGFAFFVYKTEEGARAALVEPVKNIDGHHVTCKLAVDNKKGKHGGGGAPIGDVSGVPPPQQMRPGMFRPQPQPWQQYPGYPGGGGHEPRYNTNFGQNGVPPQMPANSVGMPHGVYPDGSRHGVPPSHQAPAMPRPPSGGMYPPPYY